MATSDKKVDWAPFCNELAKKLLAFKDKSARKKLLEKVKIIYEIANIPIPTLQTVPSGKKGKPKPFADVEDIDPFTVFTFFGRRRGNVPNTPVDRRARAKIVSAMADKKVFNIPDGLVPENVEDYMDFEDMPKLSANSAGFCISKELKPGDIDKLWELFEAALEYSKVPEKSERFVKAFDDVESEKDGVPTVRARKISTGLSWIAPESFMNLSGDISSLENIPEDVLSVFGKLKKEGSISGADYLKILNGLKSYLETSGIKDFRKLNSMAYDANKNGESQSGKVKDKTKKKDKTPTDGQDSYVVKNFLEDVFMDDKQYNTLLHILESKKNIILQGPPGVGKTYAAKRLAWSILKRQRQNEDDPNIRFVQFHQNYSYEDFVMGYKPTGESFELRKGIFYKFCKDALEKEEAYKKNPKDTGSWYFLIIDEINRGNTSKIFGELLMLIENGYRGKKHALKLAYEEENEQNNPKKEDKRFYVPENLFIIGMMNTADRSLAMLDYALRRRFGFFEMKPAFDSTGFRDYCQDRLGEGIRDKNDLQKLIKDPKVRKEKKVLLQEELKKAEKETTGKLKNLIDSVKKLNEKIAKDKSLGEGFRIGHSYFCDWDKQEDLNVEREKILERKMRNAVWCDILPLLREYYFDKTEQYVECLKLLPKAFLPEEEQEKLEALKEKTPEGGKDGIEKKGEKPERNGGGTEKNQ